MLHRKFNEFKFKRTYIGGSKQRELEIFQNIQGTKEDNSDCDWFGYRRLLMQHCDDVLNIIVSWKDVLGKLRIVLVVLALLVSIISLIGGLLIMFSAILSHAIHWHLKCLELKTISNYSSSLDIINQVTGFQLDKN